MCSFLVMKMEMTITSNFFLNILNEEHILMDELLIKENI